MIHMSEPEKYSLLGGIFPLHPSQPSLPIRPGRAAAVTPAWVIVTGGRLHPIHSLLVYLSVSCFQVQTLACSTTSWCCWRRELSVAAAGEGERLPAPEPKAATLTAPLTCLRPCRAHRLAVAFCPGGAGSWPVMGSVAATVASCESAGSSSVVVGRFAAASG